MSEDVRLCRIQKDRLAVLSSPLLWCGVFVVSVGSDSLLWSRSSHSQMSAGFPPATKLGSAPARSVERLRLRLGKLTSSGED